MNAFKNSDFDFKKYLHFLPPPLFLIWSKLKFKDQQSI